MKHLTHWILALAAVATATSLSGAWTSVQQTPAKAQQTPVKQEKKLGKPPGKNLAQKNRSEKHAALRKVLPTLKTSLSEAIALAEKEAGGKAYTAGVEILEGKASIQVNLYANDKFTVANVDPETKKVTIAKDKKEEGADGADADGEEPGHEDE